MTSRHGSRILFKPWEWMPHIFSHTVRHKPSSLTVTSFKCKQLYCSHTTISGINVYSFVFICVDSISLFIYWISCNLSLADWNWLRWLGVATAWDVTWWQFPLPVRDQTKKRLPAKNKEELEKSDTGGPTHMVNLECYGFRNAIRLKYKLRRSVNIRVSQNVSSLTAYLVGTAGWPASSPF